ncbi:MAG: SsgA family sporulation/cell division regulator [Actinomycetota bacterium]|nr:SsgA family sporulation/cell division regulator [Actinomycetota bacterium]
MSTPALAHVVFVTITVGGEVRDEVAQWQFRPADPLAVSLVVPDGHRSVEWTWSRALLEAALSHPVGQGDVRLETVAGVLHIELCSPSGSAQVVTPVSEVEVFLGDAQAAAPTQGQPATVRDALDTYLAEQGWADRL